MQDLLGHDTFEALSFIHGVSRESEWLRPAMFTLLRALPRDIVQLVHELLRTPIRTGRLVVAPRGYPQVSISVSSHTRILFRTDGVMLDVEFRNPGENEALNVGIYHGDMRINCLGLTRDHLTSLGALADAARIAVDISAWTHEFTDREHGHHLIEFDREVCVIGGEIHMTPIVTRDIPPGISPIDDFDGSDYVD